MSLKTHQNYAYATITTFDNEEIYLTEDEFEYFEKSITNPNLKFIAFDDGAIAISDIRRYELVHKPLRQDRQLAEADFSHYVVTDPPMSIEDLEKRHEVTEKIKQEARNKSRSILPSVPVDELEVAKKDLEELRLKKLKTNS